MTHCDHKYNNMNTNKSGSKTQCMTLRESNFPQVYKG